MLYKTFHQSESRSEQSALKEIFSSAHEAPKKT